MEVKLTERSLSNLAMNRHLLIKIAGLTSVADWIASSEKHFPYSVGPDGKIPEPAEYLKRSRILAKQALADLGWTGWQPSEDTRSFAQLFGFERLRPLQETVQELAEQSTREPIMVLIEAPMGEGKTEAALYLYDWLQAAAGQRGLYIALPTMATSNQMFARVKEFLAKRYPRDKINLHLVHGQAGLDEDFQEISLNCGEPKEPDEAGRVVAEEWFLPRKRSLLAPFGVGTVDQALTAILQVKHNFVRLFGLAGKVVVIDEVHAYDTYTSELVDRLVEWLAALGSSVILLSATLPKRRTMELLRKYAGMSVKVCMSERYPRISWVTRGGQAKVMSVGARAQPPVRLRHCGPDIGAVAHELVGTIAGSEGCAAWICNTVGQAQEVYSLLESLCKEAGIGLSLFHARCPFEMRRSREKEVLKRFGKASLKQNTDPDYHERPRKAILVATQVIEQSLDLDFDLMITHLAPIDLILQRLGRLHRHETRRRPSGLETPVLWLLRPAIAPDGLPGFGVDAKIYTEYILLRSWLAVRDKKEINIPGDVEDLIESVYGPEGITPLDADLPVALRGMLEEAWRTARSKWDSDKGEAEGRIVKNPDDEACFVAEFNSDLKEDDPEANPTIMAATRLCRPSVQLVCLHDAGDGAMSLDSEGHQIVDPKDQPDLEMARKLLNRAVAITHPGVVAFFMKKERPDGWRRSPYLRYHRPAVFKDGVCIADGWEVRLDEKLGIVIRKGTEVDQED